MNIVNSKIRTALSLLVVLSISACATSLKSTVDVADHAEFGELKTSADIHAAAMEAADRLNDEFRLELAETIRPPTALRVSLVVATGAIDDVVQQDRLMSSDAANVSRGDDT